jgi:5-methylthioadenosine/S-adenosylhomocysteine deaminase
MSEVGKEQVSLIIQGAWVLTMNREHQVFSPGAVALSGAEIVAVGPPVELHQRYAAAQVLDYPQGLILPGLINAHTHAAMALFRGLADDLPLEEWLNNYIFPAESRLNGDFVYWGTKLAVAEMLLSGTTTFTDMYLFADHVARAAAETGIRAVVGEVLYDFPSPNYGPPAAGLKFSEDLCRTWRDHPLISVAIQPHAVYTCSPELLQECGELAEKYDTRLIMHLPSPGRSDCQGVTGRRRWVTPPAGTPQPSVLADHAYVKRPTELWRPAGWYHCLESNMKLAPALRHGRSRAPGGTGTDGCAPTTT